MVFIILFWLNINMWKDTSFAFCFCSYDLNFYTYAVWVYTFDVNYLIIAQNIKFVDCFYSIYTKTFFNKIENIMCILLNPTLTGMNLT